MTGTISIVEPMHIQGRRIYPLVIRIAGFGDECPPAWRGYTEIEVKRWPPRRIWYAMHLALWVGMRRWVEGIVEAMNRGIAAHIATYADMPVLYAERWAIRAGKVV